MPAENPCVPTDRPAAQTLWYTEPAAEWVQALPVGNGSLGGMIFSGVDQEHVQFNESTLWSGDQTQMGSYQPWGDLYIDFAGSAAGPPTAYRRELSLDDAVHRLTYTAGGVNYRREIFSSYPDQVMVIRLTADRPGALSGTLRLTDAHQAAITATADNISSSGRLSNGLVYRAQVGVLNDGGTVETVSGSIQINMADSITILLVAGTSFFNSPSKTWRGEDPAAALDQRIAHASQITYDDLKRNHIADYQALYQRVSLDLASPADDRPTADRHADYGNGTKDPGFEALLFQYGRYLLISSSRPGGLPANLQGIWNMDLKPAWYSGYTTDINIEMNYWLAETTSLGECMEPYIDWLTNLATVRKQNEQPAIAAKRGWIAYGTNNPMGGYSTWVIHRPGSAWMTQHLWSRYAFGGDKEFLRTIAYPALKELCEYWEDYLVATPDGSLITPTGWSPEHGPVKQADGSIKLDESDRSAQPGASYDQQIIWDLFTNYIEAAGALGVDASYRAKAMAMRAKLLGPQIGKWGQLQEWMQDVDSPTDHHRHVSHLFAVHPGRQISVLATPKLANAARISLSARGDGGTGWSRAWKINFWARLQDGNHAHAVMRELLSPQKGNAGGLYPNLFDAHPPFQIDGNFGCTAGIAEMLLQSHNRRNNIDVLELLPALPTAWPAGKVVGLCARGGFDVSLEWNSDKLTTASIHSRDGTPFFVRLNGKLHKITLPKNGIWIWPKC